MQRAGGHHPLSAAGGLRDVGPYRNSAPYFAALMALAIPAFWPAYLYVDKVERDWHVHVHGIALLLWGALLVAQPFLIWRGKWSLHRALGKVSFVLAPVVVVSTVLLAHHRLRQSINPEQAYFFYLQLGLIALFALAYVQAIRQRRVPALHARYMICTGLTMFDPIVARLLFFYFGVGFPQVQLITYAIIDAILLYLWKRDRDAGKGIAVFPGMLAAFVTMQVPTFFLFKTAAWLSFTKAFAAVPLP